MIEVLQAGLPAEGRERYAHLPAFDRVFQQIMRPWRPFQRSD